LPFYFCKGGSSNYEGIISFAYASICVFVQFQVCWGIEHVGKFLGLLDHLLHFPGKLDIIPIFQVEANSE